MQACSARSKPVRKRAKMDTKKRSDAPEQRETPTERRRVVAARLWLPMRTAPAYLLRVVVAVRMRRASHGRAVKGVCDGLARCSANGPSATTSERVVRDTCSRTRVAAEIEIGPYRSSIQNARAAVRSSHSSIPARPHRQTNASQRALASGGRGRVLESISSVSGGGGSL